MDGVSFWKKVDKAGPKFNGKRCWLWRPSKASGNYGQVWVREMGRQLLAHRVAYVLLVGDIRVLVGKSWVHMS